MTTTTILSEDTATIVGDDAVQRFNWGATIAGVAVATAVTFFLVTLGSGFGLAMLPAPGAGANGLKALLTLGAIYVFASQAFGFAAGAHLTGRLIGPAVENSKEEEFRAGAHGLVVWASTVVISLAILAVIVLTGSAAMIGGIAANPDKPVAASGSYWADMLLRPAGNAQQASIAYRQYAQIDIPVASDAAPAPAAGDAEAPQNSVVTPSGPQQTANPSGMGAMPMGGPAIAPNLANDKAEATRILAVDLAQDEKMNDGNTNSANHSELVRLVSQDAGLSPAAAANRVDRVESDMRADATRAAQAARKATLFTSFWTAFALLFGAIVSVAAAISARWEDDRVTFGWAPRH